MMPPEDPPFSENSSHTEDQDFEESPVSVSRKNQDVVRVGMKWAGPLPPPGLLRQYAEILPDLPQRIVAMTESEQNHRHAMERNMMVHEQNALQVEHVLHRRGQDYGFWLVVGVLFVVVYAVYKQQPWVAAALGGMTLVGLAAVFVTGRRQQPVRSDNTAPRDEEP